MLVLLRQFREGNDLYNRVSPQLRDEEQEAFAEMTYGPALEALKTPPAPTTLEGCAEAIETILDDACTVESYADPVLTVVAAFLRSLSAKGVA